MDFTSIQMAIEQAEALAEASGNCGRSVRRFLDAHFMRGQARYTLVGGSLNALLFAAQVGRLQQACALAEQAVALERGTLLFEVGAVSEVGEAGDRLSLSPFLLRDVAGGARIVDVVCTVDAIPEALKERQRFLAAFAFGLRRVLAMLALYSSEIRSDYEAITELLSDTPDPDALRTGLQQFYRLLAGDFSQREETPLVLVSLAGYLNPQVTAEADRREAEYDAALDQAFASGALASRQAPIESLFTRRC